MTTKNPLFTYLTTVILAVIFICPINTLADENNHEHHKHENHHEIHANENTLANKDIHHKEKFNPGDMIMHHVLDAHEWHVMDIGEKHITIPLPIIIYSKERGLFFFSSKKFNHGYSSYKGFSYDHRHIVPLNNDESIYDLSILKNL